MSRAPSRPARPPAQPSAPTAATSSPRTDYLPALDGLRALAVAAVFAYHLGLPWLPGGFLGVDLFFVISGFLITTLLLREIRRTGRVHLGHFWLRRAKRLLPPLALMMALVSAAASVIGRELDVALRRQVLGAAVYGSNWFQIATGSSYVEHQQPSLLTHLWSLAIEEQFYLLWPAVVLLLVAIFTRRAGRVLVVSALAIASAAWMALSFVAGGDPTRVYVGTDTHGFALLLGAALAFALRVVGSFRRADGSPSRWWPWLGVIGSGVLLAGMLTLGDTGTPTFRGGIFVVDVFAMLVVGAAAAGAGPVGRVFALRVFTFLGRRSYGIYLWHWPVIVILQRLEPQYSGRWQLGVVAVAITLALTEISWRVVETPVRTLGVRGCLRRFGAVRSGRTARARRMRPAFGIGVVVSLMLVGTAAYGVAVAPAESTLEDQLAAGEAAMAAHRSSWPPAGRPAATPTSAPQPVTVTQAAPPPQTVTVTVTTPTTVTVTAPRRSTDKTAEPKGTTKGSTTKHRTTTSTPRSTTTKPTTTKRTGSKRTPIATKPTTTNPKPTTSKPITAKPTTTPKRTTPKRTTAEPTTTKPTTTKPTTTVPPTTLPPTPPPSTTSASAPPQQPDPADGPVTAIGDSLMVGAAPNLYGDFPAIDIDATVGRQWWNLPEVLSQHARAGSLAPVVIVALGTNGSWTQGEILAALQAVGDRRVVLVSSHVAWSWQEPNNQAVNGAAADRPGTCVANWFDLANAHPQWIGPDGVHPNPEGRAAYAELLRSAVSACR